MTRRATPQTITRRELLETMGTMAVVVAASPVIDGFALSARPVPLAAVAGPDRVVMRHGKTYLNGWAGYGAPPRRGRRGTPPPPAAPDPGPAPATTWSKVSGPGTVTFADPKAPVTTAAFSAPGEYVLMMTADNGAAKASSMLTVKAELPPPATPLTPIATKHYTITSPLWSARAKALIVSWIPHCVDQINRDDLQQGPGGIDNFIEAAKALRGEPHAAHKGYVFSSAPRAYVFPAGMTDVAATLRAHNVRIRTLDKPMRVEGEQFVVKSVRKERRSGYEMTVLDGAFSDLRSVEFPPGSFYVDLAQPMANAAFYYLEPQARDGLVGWGLLDDTLRELGTAGRDVIYPIFKVRREAK